MGWSNNQSRSGFLVHDNIGPDNPIDLSSIELGKTKAALKPNKGCCGNTLCLEEFTILDVGKYKDKSGLITLFKLEGGHYVLPSQIEYLIKPE